MTEIPWSACSRLISSSIFAWIVTSSAVVGSSQIRRSGLQDTAMAMVGVGYIINVVQDSFETALNSSGDVLFTATAEYLYWRKTGKSLPTFLGGTTKVDI